MSVGWRFAIGLTEISLGLVTSSTLPADLSNDVYAIQLMLVVCDAIVCCSLSFGRCLLLQRGVAASEVSTPSATDALHGPGGCNSFGVHPFLGE